MSRKYFINGSFSKKFIAFGLAAVFSSGVFGTYVGAMRDSVLESSQEIPIININNNIKNIVNVNRSMPYDNPVIKKDQLRPFLEANFREKFLNQLCYDGRAKEIEEISDMLFENREKLVPETNKGIVSKVFCEICKEYSKSNGKLLTEEEIEEKFRNSNIFELTKRYILKNFKKAGNEEDKKTKISDDIINKNLFAGENNYRKLKNNEFEKDEVKSFLQNNFKNFLFKELLDSFYDRSDVIKELKIFCSVKLSENEIEKIVPYSEEDMADEIIDYICEKHRESGKPYLQSAMPAFRL